MTTPGGVPNLPLGALTLDTLASKTQDMTTSGMRGRANERVSSIFGSSTGGIISSDLSPFGIIAAIFSGFSSAVANADPADITGPADLPGLLIDFIESLPFVGQFVGLLEAILGTYDGEDETLLTVQEIFAPIRAIVDALTSAAGGTGGLGSFFTDLLGILGNPSGLGTGTTTLPGLSSIPLLGPIVSALLNGGQGVNGINIFGSLFPGVTSLIGAGHVGNTQPELLANPNFIGAVSVADAVGWVYDTGVAPPSSPAGAGSAKVTADGIGTKDLLSKPTIPVAQGMKFNLSVLTRWSGVTSIGTPIRLGVTAYSGTTVVSAPDVANLAASGTQATWQTLSGTYTVPAGVDGIKERYTVLPSATAGSFSFGKASVKNASTTIGTSLIADANGNGLPDILDGLDASLGGVLSSLANKVGLGDWTTLLNGLSNGSGLFSDIFDRLDDFLNSSSTLNGSNIGTGAVGDGFLPGLLTRFDSVVNNFLGISGSGWGSSDADHAIAANSAALLGLSRQVAQLQTVFTSGVTGGDEFERTATDLGTDWDVGYGAGNGTWKTDGHNAYWSKSGVGARKSIGRFIPLTAQTDYMFTTVTLSSAPEAPIIPPGTAAINRVATRMSTDRQNYVYADFGGGNVVIGRCVAGVETTLASGSLPANLGNASQISIVAGKPGTARYFKALLNGSFALDVAEAGATSMVGSSYRQGGGGGTAGAWLLALSQTAPGKMNAIVVGDQ